MKRNRSTEWINDLTEPEIESKFPKIHSTASTTSLFLGRDQEVYHTLFFSPIYSIRSLQKVCGHSCYSLNSSLIKFILNLFPIGLR